MAAKKEAKATSSKKSMMITIPPALLSVIETRQREAAKALTCKVSRQQIIVAALAKGLGVKL